MNEIEIKAGILEGTEVKIDGEWWYVSEIWKGFDGEDSCTLVPHDGDDLTYLPAETVRQMVAKQREDDR